MPQILEVSRAVEVRSRSLAEVNNAVINTSNALLSAKVLIERSAIETFCRVTIFGKHQNRL